MAFVTNMVYGTKHLLQRDNERCPRCGKKPFMHGFKYHNERYYCTHCHLWEPDWDAIDIEIKKLEGGEDRNISRGKV